MTRIELDSSDYEITDVEIARKAAKFAEDEAAEWQRISELWSAAASSWSRAEAAATALEEAKAVEAQAHSAWIKAEAVVSLAEDKAYTTWREAEADAAIARRVTLIGKPLGNHAQQTGTQGHCPE